MVKINMTSIRHRKVFQVMYLMLFLGSAYAAWLVKDAGDSALANALTIVLTLLLLKSLKSSPSV